ncbi:MAG: hypothetical protein SV253_06820 [Halobacteria archaeon]|nr:hypothetical protein [Halobacteria archaeon]
MSAVEWITGAAALVVYLVLPGLVAGVLWSPFLVSDRVRSLFDSSPVSSYVAYPVFCVVASLPYLLGLGAVFVLDPTGTATYSNAIISLSVVVTLLYAVGFPSVALLVLPRLGYDYDYDRLDDRRVTTWLLLGAGGLWYGTVMSLPLFLVAVVLALPGGY